MPSKKKIAEKETLVHMGGRGVKKIPFFWFIKKGTYSYGGSSAVITQFVHEAKAKYFLDLRHPSGCFGDQITTIYFQHQFLVQ